MSAFTFVERLRYRRQARGRHGIHSPFVYRFIEDCLNRDKAVPLGDRIVRYFKDYTLFVLPDDPAAWQETILQEQGVMTLWIVSNMYATAARKAAWEQLYRRPEVRCSMDLFEKGLLFLNPDFREKQHFILKHKGRR